MNTEQIISNSNISSVNPNHGEHLFGIRGKVYGEHFFGTTEKVFTVHMWLFPLSDCRIGRQSVIDDAHAHM